jgi:hypothetical protein
MSVPTVTESSRRWKRRKGGTESTGCLWERLLSVFAFTEQRCAALVGFADTRRDSDVVRRLVKRVPDNLDGAGRTAGALSVENGAYWRRKQVSVFRSRGYVS